MSDGLKDVRDMFQAFTGLTLETAIERHIKGEDTEMLMEIAAHARRGTEDPFKLAIEEMQNNPKYLSPNDVRCRHGIWHGLDCGACEEAGGTKEQGDKNE